MARRVTEHKDFSGGDWGKREAWNARPNQFKALNMLVYSTGEIGVRPGLKNVTPTNVVAGSIAQGLLGSESSTGYIYGQNTTLWRAQSYANEVQSAYTGAFTGAVSLLYYADTGSAFYVMDTSRGIYSAISNVLTQLTALGGNGLAFFGDRLCFGSFTGTTSNLRYNGLTAGVSDLTSWPAANIIPVGDKNERPSNVLVQRGHLTFLKLTNGLFVFTGQLGVNEVLRRAAKTLGPSDGLVAGSVVTENDLIWYVASTAHHIPVSFDGTNVKYYEDQILPIQGDGVTNLSKIAISDPDGVAIVVGTTTLSTNPAFKTTKMFLYYHGAWTRHELPDLGSGGQVTSTNGFSVFDPAVALNDPTISTFQLSHNVPVMVFASNLSTTPAFYAMPLDTDRPGAVISSDPNLAQFQNEMPGDNSLVPVRGTLELPEVHLKDADEFMVQGVVVDFRSWNTGGSQNNHFDITVDCLRPYDNTSPITSLTSAWDEAVTLSDTVGTLQRRVFMFGEQGLGNGYQLKLSNIKGVAFTRFQVILDTVNLRGI